MEAQHRLSAAQKCPPLIRCILPLLQRCISHAHNHSRPCSHGRTLTSARDLLSGNSFWNWFLSRNRLAFFHANTLLHHTAPLRCVAHVPQRAARSWRASLSLRHSLPFWPGPRLGRLLLRTTRRCLRRGGTLFLPRFSSSPRTCTPSSSSPQARTPSRPPPSTRPTGATPSHPPLRSALSRPGRPGRRRRSRTWTS